MGVAWSLWLTGWAWLGWTGARVAGGGLLPSLEWPIAGQIWSTGHVFDMSVIEYLTSKVQVTN